MVRKSLCTCICVSVCGVPQCVDRMWVVRCVCVGGCGSALWFDLLLFSIHNSPRVVIHGALWLNDCVFFSVGEMKPYPSSYFGGHARIHSMKMSLDALSLGGRRRQGLASVSTASDSNLSVFIIFFLPFLFLLFVNCFLDGPPPPTMRIPHVIP